MRLSPTAQPEAAVYDPSCRQADTASYWQWTNVEVVQIWDSVAECVNQGWPPQCELSDRSWRWYGVIFDHPGDFWLYRLFAAGKDQFGRDERYFFVLIRLHTPEEVLSPQVAGLFSYFNAERGLPLKTEPLSHGWQDAAPDEILEAISEELGRGGCTGHWGMDSAGRMTVFSKDSPLPPELLSPTSEHPSHSNPPAPTKRNHKLKHASIAAALVVVALLLPRLNFSRTPPDPPGDIEAPLTPPQPSESPPADDPDKIGKPGGDEQVPGDDTDSNPEPGLEDTDPPNPDAIPTGADDDLSPPDQNLDHSPQPSTKSPESPESPVNQINP